MRGKICNARNESVSWPPFILPPQGPWPWLSEVSQRKAVLDVLMEGRRFSTMPLVPPLQPCLCSGLWFRHCGQAPERVGLHMPISSRNDWFLQHNWARSLLRHSVSLCSGIFITSLYLRLAFSLFWRQACASLAFVVFFPCFFWWWMLNYALPRCLGLCSLLACCCFKNLFCLLLLAF